MMYRVKVIGKAIGGPVVEVFWVNKIPEIEKKLEEIKNDNDCLNMIEVVIQPR